MVVHSRALCYPVLFIIIIFSFFFSFNRRTTLYVFPKCVMRARVCYNVHIRIYVLTCTYISFIYPYALLPSFFFSYVCKICIYMFIYMYTSVNRNWRGTKTERNETIAKEGSRQATSSSSTPGLETELARGPTDLRPRLAVFPLSHPHPASPP